MAETQINEEWLAQWIAWGLHEFEALLAGHAAFEKYLHRHQLIAADEVEVLL